jgi:hypothetical protein
MLHTLLLRKGISVRLLLLCLLLLKEGVVLLISLELALGRGDGVAVVLLCLGALPFFLCELGAQGLASTCLIDRTYVSLKRFLLPLPRLVIFVVLRNPLANGGFLLPFKQCRLCNELLLPSLLIRIDRCKVVVVLLFPSPLVHDILLYAMCICLFLSSLGLASLHLLRLLKSYHLVSLLVKLKPTLGLLSCVCLHKLLCPIQN